MELKKYKFNDLLIPDKGIMKGPFGGDVKKEFFVPKGENTYKVYEQGVVYNKDYSIGNYYITEERYNKLKRFEVKPKDILISGAGTLGDLYEIPDGSEKGIINQALIRIRINESIVDRAFFKYYFGWYIKIVACKHIGASVIPNLPPLEDLKTIDTFIPSITIQKKIAAVISALDDKIALNKHINAKLEQMAKCLYDYWFVQFDFPDKNGKPYKSSGGKMVWNEQLKREIPEGWEVKKLGDVISKIDSGKRPAGGIDKTLKNGIPSLGAECIDALGVFDFTSTPFIDEKYRKIMTTGKIESNDILVYKDGAYVGKTTLFRDNFPYKEAYVNEHVFLIHSRKEELEEFLYFSLRNPTYFQIMQNLGKAKAAQPGLNREDLQNIILIIPDKKTINDYHLKVDSFFAIIFSNAKCIGKLTALRDRLLPMLMNGQVEVR